MNNSAVSQAERFFNNNADMFMLNSQIHFFRATTLMESSSRKRRRLAREAEKARYVSQIKRGMVEIETEMAAFRAAFGKLVEENDDVVEIDARLASWKRFFAKQEEE